MSSRQYLIADPDEGQRQLLDLLLSDTDSSIVAVETARQALEFLRTNTPALVVLAYELPGMTGTEVAKRLKSVARLQDVPVIVTVEPGDGFGIPEDVRLTAERSGVELLVPKPLGDKALRDRAARLMHAAETRRTRRVGRAKNDTSVIEESLRELESSRSAGNAKSRKRADGQQSEAAELERLKTANAKLKQRLLAMQETIDGLRSEVEDLKRSGKRGLFGRRRD